MLCFILKKEKSSNHVEAKNYTEQMIIELHPQQSYSILVQSTFINWKLHSTCPKFYWHLFKLSFDLNCRNESCDIISKKQQDVCF